ncbi:MAG: hypothetical protein RJB66_1497 [Pseudomonadota bacterium]|jgi:protein TonB
MPAINLQKYLLYSVFVHALVVFLLHFWGRQSPPRVPSRQAISIEIFEPETLKAKTDEPKEEKKQIVEQEKINNEIDPLANYLSSHNQKVLKETVAKNHGDFQNRKLQATPSQGANQEAVQQRKATPLPKDLFGSYKDSLAKSFDQQRRETGRAGSKGAETSQTRDYLPDKEAGVETLLSTREFVYFTYYNRIRNQLTQYWEPKIKQKILALFKKGRRIASNGDRITKVQIVLDAGGSLMKVQVLGASGVQDLDEAAVEAFKAAAPFPNPPKGIVDSDGTVKIEWEFVVEA